MRTTLDLNHTDEGVTRQSRGNIQRELEEIAAVFTLELCDNSCGNNSNPNVLWRVKRV